MSTLDRGNSVPCSSQTLAANCCHHFDSQTLLFRNALYNALWGQCSKVSSSAFLFVASYVIECYPSLPNLHTSTPQTFIIFLLLPPTSPSLPLIICHTPSQALFYATTSFTKITLEGSESRNFEKLYLKLPWEKKPHSFESICCGHLATQQPSLPHQILILYLISLVKFLLVILLLLLTASSIIGTVKEPGNCHTGSNQWFVSPRTVSPRVVSTSCFRQRNTTAGSLEIICLQVKFPVLSITGWLMPWSLEIYLPPRILAYKVRYSPCLINLRIGIKPEKARKEYKRLG